MDHFPPVAAPFHPLEVPYLGGVYDLNGFHNFDVRQRQDLGALQRLGSTDTENEEQNSTAGFLQAWFFFGLLDDVLQLPPENPLRPEDFIRTVDDGNRVRKVMTTQRLREYLSIWKTEIDAAKTDETGERLRLRNERAIQTLKQAFEIWEEFENFTAIVGPVVELSIQLLATSLEHALNCISDVGVEDLPWRTRGNLYLETQMVMFGWCPSLVQQLRYPTQLAFLYYAYLLGPPAVTLHPGCKAHDRGCKQKQIANKICRPAHVRPGCNCATAAPDLEQLDAIVSADDIPILSIDISTPEAALRVTAFDPSKMQYTAFSHIWADGLGNPKVGADRNSLPLCQLKRLSQLCSGVPWTKVSKNEPEDAHDRIWTTVNPPTEPTFFVEELNSQPLYFWLDTISVPMNHLRARAIRNMRRVYSQANRVIVLDADLLRVRGTHVNAEELLGRITCSSWIRRLWTLQEAVLARKLWYQGADDAFTVFPSDKPIAEEFFDDEVAYYCRSFDYDKWRSFARVWTDDDLPQPDDGKGNTVFSVEKVAQAWTAFRLRQGSFTHDEPGCYAALLDMPLDQIYSEPVDTRVKKLWSLYRVIPAAVLFTPAPKLHYEPGYEWAFRDLSNCGAITAPALHPLKVTRTGLLTRLPGIVLSEKLRSNRQSVIAVSISGTTFYLTQNTKQNNLPWHPPRVNTPPSLSQDGQFLEDPEASYDLQLHSHPRLGVILGVFNADKTSTEELDNLNGCLGALVAITDSTALSSLETNGDRGPAQVLDSLSSGVENPSDSSRFVGCDFLRTVSVVRKDSVFDRRTDWTGNANSDVEKEMFVEAEFTASNLGWRIGSGVGS